LPPFKPRLARRRAIAHACAMASRYSLLACVLLLFASPAQAKGPAGRYRLAGQPDEASEIVLAADGRFRYFLAAGALDERAEGRWRAEGKTLRLTTLPAPVPATFAPGPATRTAEAPLKVKVSWPDGRGIAGVDLRVGFDSGPPVEDYTQEDGWNLPSDEKRLPRWIELAVPMHGLASPRFPLRTDSANDITFVLTPNDLGVLDFSGIEVEFDRDRLLVHRGGGTLTYRRQ